MDLIGYCKDIGLVRFAGPAVKWFNPKTGEEETLCSGGRLGMKQDLIDNPDRFELLKEACLTNES
jgi:hypothetical protein